jgi:DNA-binding transcriptional ArsR family regulator
MELTGGLAANEGALAEGALAAGAEPATAEGAEPATAEGAERALAVGIAAGMERLIGLLRSLSPADGLSPTATATLATLERSGPRRLTALAVQGGVTQPAMTQLIARLEDTGLVRREADPADGRVVQVRLTDQGRAIGGDPGPDQPAGPGGPRRGAARHRRTGQRAARRHRDPLTATEESTR